MEFLIYGDTFSFYDFAYKDLAQFANVKYARRIMPIGRNKVLTWFFLFCYSQKINRILTVPDVVKRLFFKLFIPQAWDNTTKGCVIFFSRWLSDGIYCAFVQFLREKYPNVKCVCYFHDIVETHSSLNLTWLRDNFKLVLTYDKGDAYKYGFMYYPTPYSCVDIEANSDYKSDVYFLGAAKNRLDTILKVYNEFTADGFECKFFITGNVDALVRAKYPNVNFITRMDYGENLKYVKNCSCILEIMQQRATGFTPRVWEAIGYDKHLITNNRTLADACFFDNRYMHFTVDSAKYAIRNVSVNFPLSTKERMSPRNLLSYIALHI